MKRRPTESRRKTTEMLGATEGQHREAFSIERDVTPEEIQSVLDIEHWNWGRFRAERKHYTMTKVIGFARLTAPDQYPALKERFEDYWPGCLKLIEEGGYLRQTITTFGFAQELHEAFPDKREELRAFLREDINKVERNVSDIQATLRTQTPQGFVEIIGSIKRIDPALVGELSLDRIEPRKFDSSVMKRVKLSPDKMVQQLAEIQKFDPTFRYTEYAFNLMLAYPELQHEIHEAFNWDIARDEYAHYRAKLPADLNRNNTPAQFMQIVEELNALQHDSIRLDKNGDLQFEDNAPIGKSPDLPARQAV